MINEKGLLYQNKIMYIKKMVIEKVEESKYKATIFYVDKLNELNTTVKNKFETMKEKIIIDYSVDVFLKELFGENITDKELEISVKKMNKHKKMIIQRISEYEIIKSVFDRKNEGIRREKDFYYGFTFTERKD